MKEKYLFRSMNNVNSKDFHFIKMEYLWDGMNIAIIKHRIISRKKIVDDTTISSVNLDEESQSSSAISHVRISGTENDSVSSIHTEISSKISSPSHRRSEPKI